MKIDPPSPSLRRGKQFFAELKRRNVYKVAVAYAVVAWLLVQIATQIFPFLEIEPGGQSWQLATDNLLWQCFTS